VIRHAKAKGLDRSTVTDAHKGAARDTARTSSHVFLEDGDPVGEMIRQRVSRLTGAPVSRMEHVQILRYMPGEEYRAHYVYDACNDGCDGGRDMPRTETVLVYLNSVDEGGHTAFPTAGVSVAPKPGRAVRWPNIDATGTNLPCSFHAGTPVIRGEKWAATVWIR
jgi:prolyl 4-hydroxylase